MKRAVTLILAALSLAACANPNPEPVEPRSCSPSAEVAGDGWRTTVCPADSPAAWAAALAAENIDDVDDLGAAIDWCVYDDAGSPTCGTAYVPPHPWCTGDDEDPTPCFDVACCILTLLNEGCGGCLDPGGEDSE